MPLKSLDIVQMQVKDWDAAVRWYEEKLSFRVLVRQDDHRFSLLGLPEGSCQLAIFGVESVTLGTRNRCIPSILVDSLPQTLSELDSKGVTLERALSGGEEGYRMATISDCEGNLIHLYEWYSPEKATG